MPRLGDKFSDEQKRKLGYNEGKNNSYRKERRNYRERKDSEFLWRIDPFEGDSVSLILGKLKPLRIDTNLPPYGKRKEKFLKRVLEFYRKNFKISEQILKSRINALKDSNFKMMKFKLVKKVIIGFGNPSALETGLTLHHIYGFPYIPASSIKGVVRDTALREMFPDSEDYENLDKRLSKLDIDEVTEDERIFVRIFGSQKYRGEVIFTDMIPDPSNSPKLDIDVINVHYGKYYSNLYSEKKNIEWKEEYERDDPNPVFFLIVKGGSFILLYKVPGDLEDRVREFINSALTEHGVGAKTRFNYGFFERI